MSNLFFSFLLALSTLPGKPVAPTLTQVRELYKEAAKSETACKDLLAILEPYDQNNNALYLGYKASATMMMAKHSLNPFSKLSWFNKGKRMLETAIKASQKNVELRCLRFAAQSNIPSFLGYHDHIKLDKTFILEKYSQVKDETLKKNIVTFLTEWGKLTPAEREVLK